MPICPICKGTLAYRTDPRYGGAMTAMIWIGAILSVLGLIGVLWCLRKAAWLRKAQLDDTAVRSELFIITNFPVSYIYTSLGW